MVFAKRVLMAVVGFILIGFSLTVLLIIDSGLDPFGAMVFGFSMLTGFSFGITLAIVQVPLILFILWKRKKLIGLGTLLGMFGTGFIVDFFYWTASLTVIAETQFNLLAQLIILMPALLIFSVGAALYMTADLGMGPYDATAVAIEDLSGGKLKFKWVRLATDAICAAAAFVLGATLGISTVVMVFFIGPLISYFRKKFKAYFTFS